MDSEKTIETFNDYRARRYFDLFDNMSGQVTASIVQPNQFSGWHMHKLQTDQFCVVNGRLLVVVIHEDGCVKEHVLDSENPYTLTIRPKCIHAYKSYEKEATLLYYLSRKHDESDEFRYSEDQIFDLFGYRIKWPL